MRFSVALIIVMICFSGCGPSKPEPTMREKFEATEKLLSAWDKEIKGSRANYIRLLISEGADVNMKDSEGMTPLMHATGASAPDIVALLIEEGAEVNVKSDHDNTALFIASKFSSNPEIVQLLLEKGAEVNAKDSEGLTSLMVAVKNPSNPQIVELLLEKGADVEARNKYGWTPLMIASSKSPSHVIAQMLLENGAKLEARNNIGSTPLMIAATFASAPEVVRLLIEKGADVNARNPGGVSPLMFSFYKLTDKAYEIRQLLIAAGAKGATQEQVFQATEEMMRALREGVDDSLAPYIHGLIIGGADVNAIDIDGKTPLLLATTGVINVLRKAGAKGPSRIEAIQATNNLLSAWNEPRDITPEYIRSLISEGADVNAKDSDRNAPLTIAAGFGRSSAEIIQILLDAGADVNAKGFLRNSPLESALMYDNAPEIVELLLENGADVNAKGLSDCTPLMTAAEFSSNPEIVQLLLEKGAEVNAKDSNGKTLLDFASNNRKGKFLEMRKLLIDAGAK